MLLIIDNYDSFVYNLVQYFGELGEEIIVVRNDQMSLDDLESMSPQRIVISPGPGIPENAGVCIDLIRRFSGRVPILGVCLGHQCIGSAFGARVVRGEEPYHGKTSLAYHENQGILKGIPREITVARYHSLVIEKGSLPRALKVTAVSSEGTIMAVQHETHPTFGLQFHPESIASQHGREILKNFIFPQPVK
ncbi:MAG: aminodeoxychorismate/anthranilate synthase component II [Clostridia bacterium]|nr:aminodeoxychorismate/anthranilate synthase component II [Clostridia bacterium]